MDWRDDRLEDSRNEYPSVSRMVKCATDQTEFQSEGVYGTYRLDINHVLSFHGKQFMPSLYRLPSESFYGGMRPGEWAGNGNTATTYEEALEAGKTWLAERVAKDKTDWEEFEKQQADIKRRRAAGEFVISMKGEG